MRIRRLHEDEPEIELRTVRALVERDLPALAGLPIRPVEPGGTSNVVLALGDRLLLRLPRTPGAAAALQKERGLLPRLAHRLPTPIPELVATGDPGFGYPFPWAVLRRLDGRNPNVGVEDPALARDLAGFVLALHALPFSPAESADPAFAEYRGGPIADLDDDALAAIAACADLLDTGGIERAWHAMQPVPAETGRRVRLHTDLMPGNLLVDAHGRLAGVLDWGGAAIGDPAVDLLPAWNLFGVDGRRAFREAIGADAATWARGRAWALVIGLVALPYYAGSDAALAAVSRYQIGQVLADLA